jgi:hypothetical protein
MAHKVGTDIKIVYYIHSQESCILLRYLYYKSRWSNFANCEECRTVRKMKDVVAGQAF